MTTETTTGAEATGLTTHHLEVPGGQLYYEVRGSGPLLLVIGQPMTAAPFAPLADLLAGDRTVVTYDPHGLGQSTIDNPSAAVTPEVEAEDLARIIEAVGGGPADVFGSSGGAVAGLALAARHPDLVRTLVAHEPPVTELLPDAVHVRAVVDETEEAFRAHGSGAAWGKFVSVVMHQGEVTADGVRPATWTPPGQDAPDPDSLGSDGSVSDGAGSDGPGSDGAAAAPEPTPPPEPTEKQRADDALFFLRMLTPFTRYEPEVETLRSGPVQLVIAVGATSGDELARRSTLALAERLGVEAVPFPGDHTGFMADPEGFADQLREVLPTPA